jgi:hypothetical protein
VELMNLILNSRFAIAQRGTPFSPAVGHYTLDRWRAATAGFTIAQGSNGRKAVITLTASGTVGIVQPIESQDSVAAIGDVLDYGVNGVDLVGMPLVTATLLGWTGTADKPTAPGRSSALATDWQIIAGAVPPVVKNLALLIEIEGAAGDAVELDEAFVGINEHRRYRDDLAACSLFYQRLSTKYHASENIFYGRITQVDRAHMELPLPFPIRGRDGSEGAHDVKVTFNGLTFNTSAADGNMWVYAGGEARRVTSHPTLTCVHRQHPGLGFTMNCSQGGFEVGHAAVARTYYANQASIDAAVNTDFIEVDAELRE